MNYAKNVKGHEMELFFDHEIKFFSSFFMRSKFLIMILSPDHGICHGIKIQKKELLGNFDLMINLFVSYKYNHEIKIQKSIIRQF